MTTTTIRFSAALLIAASAPAWSQGRLDGETMKLFGGTYMSDCANNAAAKATVFAEALVLLDGDKRVAGAKPLAVASYYDPNTPPDLRTVLMSDAPGGRLLFAIYQDKAGYFLKLDGDAKALAPIGKALTGQKFRHCDGGASKPVQVAATATPKKKYELHELDAGGVMLDSKLKATYLKALGPLARERWLAKLDGPSPQNKRVKVAGADYVLLASCKNHDCADHNTVLLYSSERDTLYGTVYQKGKTTLIGEPPPAVAAELPKLWKKEWRSS